MRVAELGKSGGEGDTETFGASALLFFCSFPSIWLVPGGERFGTMGDRVVREAYPNLYSDGSRFDFQRDHSGSA